MNSVVVLRKICVIVRKNLYFLFYSGYSYAKDYYKGGGYICPSDIFYGRPKRSINTYGQWKVISLRISASQSMDIIKSSAYYYSVVNSSVFLK